MMILPVVEGDGDIAAVPELVRRVAHHHDRFDVVVARPHKRGDLPKVRSRFDDYLATALLEGCPILWVLDYDCDSCDDVQRDIEELGLRAGRFGASQPIEFALMVKEFETLFLADRETTRKVLADIPEGVRFPDDPEAVRDAKGWLSSARPKGSSYKPTQHQQRIASQLDLGVLRRRSASFHRFETSVLRLLSPSQQ